MISALAKSTWCICQALSKGFLLVLVFLWQALPKGLLHVQSIPSNGVLVLLATPWQALSKGLLHVERNKTFFVLPWQALAEGLLHVQRMCRRCVVSPWQALPKGLHVHSFTYVSPRLALPKGMLEVPDEISQKICCSWAVPGWFQLIVLLIFHVFWGNFFYWFSCPRNLCFLFIRSTHRINICNWFHGIFFQHKFPYWLGSITDAQGTLLSNESNLRQIYSQTNLLSNESNLRRIYCQTNLLSNESILKRI